MNLEDLFGDLAGEPAPPEDEDIESGPAIALVGCLLDELVASRASALHLEPADGGGLGVRLRVDGVLRPASVASVPPALARSVIARLKIVGMLDISERRRPQAGRFALERPPVELAIFTLPSVAGEAVVVRPTGLDGEPRGLHALGLELADGAAIEAALELERGLVLVAGPARAGKRTLIEACLRRLTRPDRSVVAIGVAVRPIPGVIRVEPSGAAGFTTAGALAAALRCEADVLAAGDIHGHETARLAVETAAARGLVLGTIHTFDAPATVGRLLDMGIEPFLVADALALVLAVRLVRRLCAKCKAGSVPPPPEVIARLGAGLGPDRNGAAEPWERVYRASGCPACGGTGYRGRLPIVERLEAGPAVRAAITGAPGHALADALRRAVPRSLRSAALELARRGETSIEEAVRATPRPDAG